MTALSSSPSVVAATDRVSFPRADDSSDLIYRERYCAESKPLMRRWIVWQLDWFQTYPKNVTAGACMLEGIASAGMSRPVNANERELLERVLRDVIEAHAALARQAERELQREVL